MSHIFGAEDSSSDENDKFKLDNEYAKKYDVWRKKEELNRLKTKYGEDVFDEEEESSSSSDDEEGIEITKNVERDFFKTLACLKNKDPSIYKKDVTFFSKKETDVKVKKKEKDKPMFLKDYERNLILEKGGVLSDEEDENDRPRTPTYNEEQNHIKESFKNVMEDSDNENEEHWGGLFKQREKSKVEVTQEEEDYKQWLVGQKKSLDDEKMEKDLKPLKEYWNKPDLEDGEKFLRDYILNKKYLQTDDDNYVPTYDEIIHDSDKDLSNDEENIEKQDEFEHKYNFRYEEPDQEFIKRYPRTMENSLRKTDDRRKLKRQEVKERKKIEKEEKMQEVKKMQELKLKEIEEKLEKLKEITGNESLGFADADIDGDFDPEEHDRKMQVLFNDEFYNAPEDEQKPEFPDLDEELEIENWERYNGDNENANDYGPHCEDEDFNMDCDFDPQTSKSNNDDEQVQGRKKRKRKSKFAVAVSKPKPKYDPNDKKFEKYFEEYYKLDCEDIIGDTPCRFKYRQVAPNDFGLTTEEILLANERELNKWCSLKKAVQIRSDEVERYEQIAYQKKGQNINLKKKILPSLFVNTPEDNATNSIQKINDNDNNAINQSEEQNETMSKSNQDTAEKKTKKRKLSATEPAGEENKTSENRTESNQNTAEKKKTKKQKLSATEPSEKNKTSENRTEGDKNDAPTESKEVQKVSENKSNKKKKKKKKKKSILENQTDTSSDKALNSNTSNEKGANKVSGNKAFNKNKRKHGEGQEFGKRKKPKFSKEQNKSLSISDARLSAYGINPK
uniref:Protein KRI1 homolog n=1 Tax=Diabrotica virgifera virgifera TaxID=50390 RepID=A0A6P7GKN9_DIAVI